MGPKLYNSIQGWGSTNSFIKINKVIFCKFIPVYFLISLKLRYAFEKYYSNHQTLVKEIQNVYSNPWR